MFTKKSYIMKNKKEIEGMFDDDVVNSDHQDSMDNNDVQALPPKSDETEQFGIMEAALIFQRGKDELEKNTNVFVDMQKQFVSRMERTTKDVRVSLDEADRRLILNLPQQTSGEVTNTLDDYLPKKVKEFVSEIIEEKEDACKEIEEKRSYSHEGIWISNKVLYIATAILLTSMSFGGWGVAQLGETYKTLIYWIGVLGFPLFLLLKWFVKEKLFPKDDMKYPWRR